MFIPSPRFKMIVNIYSVVTQNLRLRKRCFLQEFILTALVIKPPALSKAKNCKAFRKVFVTKQVKSK